MKRPIMLLVGLLSGWMASAESIFLECEQFENLGGWKLDSQFIDEMGSSYLLAHGLGKTQPPQNDNCGGCKFRKPTDNPNYKKELKK